MQYEQLASGKRLDLPRPSIDTGMGLERIAAVLQGAHSNYDIDLFQDLIRAAARETHSKDLASNSLKVIADHIRACSFLIVDGVLQNLDGVISVKAGRIAGLRGPAAESHDFH